MKKNLLLAVASAVTLAGCDYTVSLTDAPELPIDKALVGSWERTTNQGERQHLLFLPISKTEYLVSFPPEKKTRCSPVPASVKPPIRLLSK